MLTHALTVVLTITGLAPTEGEGSIGLRAGYRYVPNPFFSQSAEAGDPVVSNYLGGPGALLHFDYSPTDVTPVAVEVEWGGERLELESDGWIETQAVAFSLSAAYRPRIDFWLWPYGGIGLDYVAAVVTDKIESSEPITGIKGTFGVHAALGVVAPCLYEGLPELGAVAELRYTLGVLAQRGRAYHVLGPSIMIGLQWRVLAEPSRLPF